MSTQTPEVPSMDGPITKIGKSAMDRRRFLMTSGMVAGVAVAAVACGSDGDSGTSGANATTATTALGGTGTTSTTAAASTDGGGDLAIAKGAAGLEVLAVNTYKAALDAASAGDLGEVPPAVAEFATTAKKNHQDALDAWNELLTSLGEGEVDAPPADLEATVNDQFAQVTDATGVAELALMLETIANQTYLDSMSKLEANDAITLAGQLQIVDMQHAAVLNFVLGEYPVPDTFQPTTESILT